MAERQCGRAGWGFDPDVVGAPQTYLYRQRVIDAIRPSSFCHSLPLSSSLRRTTTPGLLRPSPPGWSETQGHPRRRGSSVPSAVPVHQTVRRSLNVDVNDRISPESFVIDICLLLPKVSRLLSTARADTCMGVELKIFISPQNAIAK